METALKVFVSHASEDKDRFVRKLALRLRARGIEAWVDEWEIRLGDRLVEKIFEEGVRDSGAFIVVISAFSVSKRRGWVREELSAAIMKRINQGTRIIPIVLDNADVPEALKDTVWVRVDDLESCDAEIDRVVSDLYEIPTKPPLGPPPEYVSRQEPKIDELTRIDVIVLRLFGERALEKASTLGINTEDRWRHADALGISRQNFLDSLEILESRGLLEQSGNLARVPNYNVTLFGFDKYVHAFEPEYDGKVARIVLAIINDDLKISALISERLEIPKLIVDHVLQVLKSTGLVELDTAMGGYMKVSHISAQLRRNLQQVAT